ncbi:putative aminoacyltransferase, E1 ubiquitin-activating enzyme [Lupinus albus]|uniref:RING-type E3 ubiquitin transferase n=1 Tax=Lupinus albus TaxID=3870 RepID=A0A6A4PX74_LUPAL|nr:putative aminoacyltransferase, E1 ubiquitin-activating enzyme [Lupinus albus]
MEKSMLKVLSNGISTFLHLSFSGNIYPEPASKYYRKSEEILKLLKPIIDSNHNSDFASDEVLDKLLEALDQTIDELRELIEHWHLLSSKLYFAMQVEPLISRIRALGLNILGQLKCPQQCLPDDMRHETSSIIKEAIMEQQESIGPGSEVLAKIAENLELRTNQAVLIEVLALENLKDNAEQTKKTAEAEYIDQMISVVTRMHEHLIRLKQAEYESSIPVPVPADFCCPLSLELMIDPVIVASGQTYERAFIKDWINLGLNVCPKTRQTLVHPNLIPNYTVKAFIVNWCESNNVKLVDPIKSTNLNQPSVHNGSVESGSTKLSQLITSDETNQEGTSPSHPISASEGSLSGMVNGQCVDLVRISSTDSDDRSANADEGSVNSVDQSLMSPSPRESSDAFCSEQSQAHVRTASNSCANFPQGTQADNNSSPLMSTSPVHGQDASGELNPGPEAATMPTLHREPDFPPQLVEGSSRIQTGGRRLSERFVPRIVPSPSIETRADLSGIETEVRKLVEYLKSSSLDTQRDATLELRFLAKHNMDNRIVIANCGAISLLVDLLQSTDIVIQENSVTTLLNLSINDNNKTAIANAGAIEALIHVLETGSPEAKENSAATLFSISVIEENKIRIGRSRAIGPLVDLLGNGTPRGKRDAATALFNLSILPENKNRIVEAGAVKHLVDLMDPAAGMVDKAVAVLANLSTISEGSTEIFQQGGIPVLVEVVELASARGKENAAAALVHLCSNNPRYLNIVLQEGAVPPLVALSQSGTPRAKEKALALLNQFRNQRHNGAGRV